jgi:hypothetical protein
MHEGARVMRRNCRQATLAKPKNFWRSFAYLAEESSVRAEPPRFISSGSLPIWLNESSTTGSRRRLNVVAGIFMAIFEGKLGDARFIEFAQSFCDHAVALGLEILENPSNA